jgi:hypothetical protein
MSIWEALASGMRSSFGRARGRRPRAAWEAAENAAALSSAAVEVPRIETEQLLLRGFRADDVRPTPFRGRAPRLARARGLERI